jgi:hypothetical protein
VAVVAAGAVDSESGESCMRPSNADLLRTLALLCALVSPLALAQKAYPSAEAAADAFTEALRKADRKALGVVLGTNYKQFVPTGSVDRVDVESYLVAWDKQHKVNAEGDQKAVISVGDQGWTMPVPIVKRKAGWQFDRNTDGIHEYAQKFVSTKGKKDGLYWESPLGLDESPLGPLLAQQKPKGPGYYGYHYKILTGQGKDAPGGAYDYIIGKRMRSGFAAVAWPARYGDTGVMTFMVSHAGIVYEKDLGPSTEAIAPAMTRFNPDSSWKKSPVPN